MITHIIWDFNGTVLDDVNMAVAAVNDMLVTRALPSTNVEAYRDTLTMPLTEYYKTVGIFTDDIPTLSQEFYACCEKHPELACVPKDVKDVLCAVRELGICNVLMSSLHHERLLSECARYGVDGYFSHIIGLPDRGLGSKQANAMRFLEQNGIEPKNVLFVGDLASDAQMAKAVGGECILIPRGHMSKERCVLEGVFVYDDFRQIIEHIKRA